MVGLLLLEVILSDMFAPHLRSLDLPTYNKPQKLSINLDRQYLRVLIA
jgi:hypothetical protein